jgi:hypothetical protein
MSDDHRFDKELELNRRAYADLRDQIRRDYAGKYVGLAFGRVMAAGDDFDAVTASMNSLDPPPACSLVFPAEDEPLFDPPEPPPYYEFAD